MMTDLSDPITLAQPSRPPARTPRHRLLDWSLITIGLVPMLLLAHWVWRYGVNIPHWDQWGLVYLFHLMKEGQLGWEHLFQQHNESRKVFPRLLFLTLGQFTGWNVRYEMASMVLLAGITSLNIYVLARRTVVKAPALAGWPWAPTGLWLLANLLIFSPVQYENWLWGIQVVVFAPITLLTTGLVIAICFQSLGLKTILCALVAFIATFSYANGLIVWVLLGAALMAQHWESIRPRWWVFAAFAAACLLSICLYFHDYQRPPAHPSLAEGLKQPINVTRYFLAFLGSPLRLAMVDTGRQLAWARWAGAALVVMFGIACLYALPRNRRQTLLQPMMPWILIGGYAIASALITAAGRASFGKMSALESRYTSFALYLPVALLPLAAIVLADAAKRHHMRLTPRRAGLLAAVLVVTLIVSHVLTSIPAVRWMRETQTARLAGMAMLHWIRFAPEPMLERRLYPDLDVLKDLAAVADELHLLSPPLARSPIPLDRTESDVIYGSFERLHWLDGELVAAGWAMLPHRNAPADAVLLTWQLDGGEHHVFAVAIDRHARRDIARRFGDDTLRATGWRKIFKNDTITITPPEGATISAWAFDAQTTHAYRLRQDHLLSEE